MTASLKERFLKTLTLGLKIGFAAAASDYFSRYRNYCTICNEHCDAIFEVVDDALGQHPPMPKLLTEALLRDIRRLADEREKYHERHAKQAAELVNISNGDKALPDMFRLLILLVRLEHDARSQARTLAGLHATWSGTVAPPRYAEFILEILTAPKLREAVVGDAAETYIKNMRIRGKLSARTLYCVDAVRSIAPLFGRMIERCIEALVRGAMGSGGR